MNPFRIRRYRPCDHDAVWELHNLALEATGAHGGSGPWDDDLHHVEEAYLRSGGEFLVGTLDGRVVAMGALKRLTEERAEIKRMRVHPDFWRRGFGQRILGRLERKACESGYRSLVLDTTTGQTAAQELYRGSGYVETGRRRRGPFELILFEKQLSRGEPGHDALARRHFLFAIVARPFTMEGRPGGRT
jgi:ribosomal protein S18 acetylase RimI-like enzyme